MNSSTGCVGEADEIIKNLKGYEDYYWISSKAYVKSKKTGYIPKTHINSSGYDCVCLCFGNKKIRKRMGILMAENFLIKPDSTQIFVVNNINCIKSDSRLENLRYVTQSQSAKYATNHINNINARIFIVCKMDENGKVIQRYNSPKEAAIAHGLHNSMTIVQSCRYPNRYNKTTGCKWRYGKKNRKYKPELRSDEVFKKILFEEHNLFFSKYEISNYGNVRIYGTNKYKKPRMVNGYYRVSLVDDDGKPFTLKNHRLTAFAFVDKPKNYNVVNHLNKNKLDNSVSNLEWTTIKGNNIHSGGKTVHKIHMQSGIILETFPSSGEAAISVGGHASGISNCCHGRDNSYYGYKWKYDDSTEDVSKNKSINVPLNKIPIASSPKKSIPSKRFSGSKTASPKKKK